MAKRSARSEADLAQELNKNLQSNLKSKRLISITLSALFLVGATIFSFFGFAMTSFCLFVVALIYLVRYFDANSHLHEVRRRSTKTLFPRISLLHRKDQSASTKQGQSLAKQ